MSSEAFGPASVIKRAELLNIPGGLISPFIAFEILAYQGMEPWSKTAQQLKTITPDPLVTVIRKYLSFQAQVVDWSTPFVRLFPSTLIGFRHESKLVIAKANHTQTLTPDSTPGQIYTAAKKIITAAAQPVVITGDQIQTMIKQMLSQPRPIPER